jgi:hypothetical protein
VPHEHPDSEPDPDSDPHPDRDAQRRAVQHVGAVAIHNAQPHADVQDADVQDTDTDADADADRHAAARRGL